MPKTKRVPKGEEREERRKEKREKEAGLRRHRFSIAVLLGLVISLWAVPVLEHNAVFIESFFALFLLYDLLQELLEPSFKAHKSVALGLLAVVGIAWVGFVLQFGSLHHHIHHRHAHAAAGHEKGHEHAHKAPTYSWESFMNLETLQLELHSLNFVLVVVSATAVFVRMLIPSHAEKEKEE